MCVATSRGLHIFAIRRWHLIMPNISRASDTELTNTSFDVVSTVFLSGLWFFVCVCRGVVFLRRPLPRKFLDGTCVCLRAWFSSRWIFIFDEITVLGFVQHVDCVNHKCGYYCFLRCRHHAQWNNFTRSSILAMHLKNNYKQALWRVYLLRNILPNLATKRTMKKQLFGASNIDIAGAAQNFPHGCQREGGL